MVDWQKAVFDLSDSKILLYLVQERTASYSDLLSSLIQSRSTLAGSLSQLQSAGLVKRTVRDTRPIQTEYALTDKGEQFARQLIELRNTLKL